jgi:hypothetical protein
MAWDRKHCAKAYLYAAQDNNAGRIIKVNATTIKNALPLLKTSAKPVSGPPEQAEPSSETKHAGQKRPEQEFPLRFAVDMASPAWLSS